jgi:prepilin-type processing-associated H-X9-DG protein
VQPRPRGDAHGTNWDPLGGADQTWGWPYQILPYVNPTIDVEDDLAVAASPVEIYVCPSRNGQMIRELVPGWGERVAFDYAGNCGPYLYGSLDPGNPAQVIPEDGPGDSNVPHLGIFGRRPLEARVSLGSLEYAPGTVLIGDKALNIRNGSPTDADTAGWVGGWPVDEPYHGAPPPDPPGRAVPLMTDTIRSGRFPPGPDGPQVFDGFGAPHNGGGNFGFADGHADWISSTIDPDVFRKLCSRVKGTQ